MNLLRQPSNVKTPKDESSHSVSVFLYAVLVVGYFYIDCTLFQESLKMNNNETLLEDYKTACPDLTKQVLFKKAHKEWNRVKGSPEN